MLNKTSISVYPAPPMMVHFCYVSTVVVRVILLEILIILSTAIKQQVFAEGMDPCY